MKLDSMTSVSNWKSLLEVSFRQPVGEFAQQGLLIGLSPSQDIEANASGVKIHLAAYQPMHPLSVDLKEAAREVSLSVRRRPAQIDQTSRRRGLEIEAPIERNRPPVRPTAKR